MPEYRKYRAPTANDTALVDPSWTDQLRQLADPAPLAAIDLAGAPLTQMATEARRDLIEAAVEHTSQYADVDAAAVRQIAHDGPVVVSGHQPELFHSGVWFKNFALDALAKSSGGVGVHLLIDSDLCRDAHVRTPSGTIAAPRWETVPLDAAAPPLPYEERRVEDFECFASFDARIAAAVGGLIDEPLVTQLWPDAREAARRTGRLGAAVSIARHQLEQLWGAQTLEAPISRVADAPGFRRLAAHLLLTATDVRRAYNAALADYRAAHRLRTPAQPLPDMATDESGVEVPLWVWSESAPARQPLFVSQRDGELLLSDRAGWNGTAPADPEGLVEWLADARAAGVKIRGRALVTTLFARFALGDLFLHGIGGAKYDQVTDRFAAAWLGASPPPPHATLTATVRLPLDHQLPSETDRLRLVKRRRDLRYHPERFLHQDATASGPIDAKRRWVAAEKTPANAAERHQAISRANDQMRALLRGQLEQTESELHDVQQRLKSRAILDSREHSFVLFPAEDVRRRLRELCRITPGA